MTPAAARGGRDSRAASPRRATARRPVTRPDVGVTYPSDDKMTAVEFGAFAEEHGAESLWFSEHTHIPVARATPSPADEAARPHVPPLSPTRSSPRGDRRDNVARPPRHRAVPADAGTTRSRPRRRSRPSTTSPAAACSSAWSGLEQRGATEPRHRPEAEVRRADRAADAIRTIWTQEEPEFHGRFVSSRRSWALPEAPAAPHPPTPSRVRARRRRTEHCAHGALAGSRITPSTRRR